jgi:hypothetical protein
MSKGRVYRVGIDVSIKDRISMPLRTFARGFLAVHRNVETLKKSLAGFDSGMLRGLGKQAERFSKIHQSMKGTINLQQQQVKLIQGAAKAEGARALATERTRTQQQKTLLLAQKIAHTEQSHSTRLSGLRQKNLLLEGKLGQQRQINAQRLQQASLRTQRQEELARQTKIRTLLLEERITRQKERQIADNRRILDLQDRALSKVPHPGNLIGGGLAMAGGGVRVLRSGLGISKDEDLRHYVKERTGLEQLNLNPAELEKVNKAIERIRGNVSGLKMYQSVDVIKDLINVTGDVDKVAHVGLAERFAKFRVANEVAYGLDASQSMRAMQAAEMMILSRPGMTMEQRATELEHKLDLINKMVAGSAGKVKPAEIRNFLSYARANRFGISDEGLFHLMPIVAEKGGAQVGTMLSSVMDNLAYGRTPTAAAKNLMDMGLLDKAKVEYDKSGRVKRVKPGGVIGTDLLQSNPMAWVEEFLMPKLKGKSDNEIKATIASIVGRRTSADLLSTMVFQQYQINKDAKLYAKARGVEGTDAAQQENSLRAERNYEAAVSNLRTKMGLVLLPSLTWFTNKLAGGIDRLNSVVTRYPTLAKIGTIAVGAAAGLTVLAGSLITFFGAIRAWKALKVLSGGGPGGPGGGLEAIAVEGAGELIGNRMGRKTAETGAKKAGSGLLKSVGGMLFGNLLSDAIAKSPLVRGLGKLKVGGAAGGIAKFGSSIGSIIAKSGWGVASKELGSGLVRVLPNVLRGAGLVGAAAAVGVGIGSLIQRGLEESGMADRMQGWLAENLISKLPTWMGGVAPPDPVKPIKPRLGQSALTSSLPANGRGALHLSESQRQAIQAELSPKAQAIADRRKSSPPPARPAATGAVPGVTVPVNITVPQGATVAPEAARKASKQAGRLVEESVFAHLTTMRPTQTTPKTLA